MPPGLSIFKYQSFPFSFSPGSDLALHCFSPQECSCWEVTNLSTDGKDGESRDSEPEEFQDLLRLHF